MLTSLLLTALIMLADEPPSPKVPSISIDEQKAFDLEKTKAGNDPTRLIKLAMWAESKGLTSERTRILTEVTAIDPKNEAAWGLLGRVSHQGTFRRPEEVVEETRGNDAHVSRSNEYNDRRDRLNTAEESERALIRGLEAKGNQVEARAVQGRIDHRLAPAHLKLGLWCESNGMGPEARAHFTSATMLDPYLEIAWKHLGYVRHKGQWMTHDQIALEAKELATQRQADLHWGPLLQRWKGWLGQDSLRATAEKNLIEVTDPRALPSIIKTFVTSHLQDQKQAVRLLGSIDTPASAKELAFLAVQSDFEPVRRESIETLKGRDLRDYAEPLVKMIHGPWTYKFVPVQGPGAGGTLEIDTARFHLTRTYDAPPAFQLGSNFHGYVGMGPDGMPLVMSGNDVNKLNHSHKNPDATLRAAEVKTAEMIASAQLKAESSRQQMKIDINEIERNNETSAIVASLVAPVLHQAAGAPRDLRDDEDAWHTWYYDKIGYRYTPPMKQTFRHHFPQVSAPRIVSCFAAGTPVRTMTGPRAIESLNVGDQVLSQDPRTGGLSFQSILVVHRNPPDQTLDFTLENGDRLIASRFHRFWLADRGWVMARDLKAGDVLRTLGGRSTIQRIEQGPVLPVYNLDVAGGRTFFVGDHDALVHDNTMPSTLASHFDAKAEVAGSRP